MHRREFLKAGIGGAACLSTLHAGAFATSSDEALRVALIGTGWYGKTDLLHLNQVAEIDVVGL